MSKTHPGRRFGPAALTAALLLALTACSTVLEQPATEKRLYLVAAERGAPLAPPTRGPVLAVQPFTVSPAYEGQGLVLRRPAAAIESDFYHQFFIPPAAMVETAAAGWLRHSGLFLKVGPATSELPPGLLVSGNLAALYGDFTTPGQPKAVLELQLLLLDARPGANPAILARSDERRELPLALASSSNGDAVSDALVRAWSEALGQILSGFEGKVRTALAPGR